MFYGKASEQAGGRVGVVLFSFFFRGPSGFSLPFFFSAHEGKEKKQHRHSNKLEQGRFSWWRDRETWSLNNSLHLASFSWSFLACVAFVSYC
jgi:hypothetical protein